MTLSTTTNRVSITGNGVTTAISFPYYFLSNSDLVVVKVTIATGVETAQVLNTDYTVTGAGVLAGGTVTMTTAPSSSFNIVVYRNPAVTQAVDVVENEALPAATLEQALDKSVMLHQRSRELVSRALRQPEGDTADIDYLPAKVARASKYLSFDSDGDPVATAGTTSSAIISTFAETFLDDTTAAAVRTTLDVFEDVFTTRGDLLRAGAAGAEERVALGASGKVVTSDGTDAVWDFLHMPRGYIDGCKLSNNGSDATNDIDIAAGVCRDDSNAANLTVSALTKQLDAAWAVGTNAGGIDTGAKAANTWYAIWAIRRPDTGVVDVLFSASFSAPTMPTNYTQKRRIGAVRTDNASALYAFTQVGDDFFWKTPTLDVNSTGFSAASAAVTFTLSGTSTQGSPPVEGTLARLNLAIHPDTGAGRVLYVRHPSDTDSAASLTVAPLFSSGDVDTGVHGSQVLVRTNASSQITARPDGTIATVRMSVASYQDLRGKDA